MIHRMNNAGCAVALAAAVFFAGFAPAFEMPLAENTEGRWTLDVPSGEYRVVYTADAETDGRDAIAETPLRLNGRLLPLDRTTSPEPAEGGKEVCRVQTRPFRVSRGDVLTLFDKRHRPRDLKLVDRPLPDAWRIAFSAPDLKDPAVFGNGRPPLSFDGTKFSPGELVLSLRDFTGKVGTAKIEVDILDYWRNIIASKTFSVRLDGFFGKSAPCGKVAFSPNGCGSYRADVRAALPDGLVLRRVFTCEDEFYARGMHRHWRLDDALEWETAEVREDGTYETRRFRAAPPEGIEWKRATLPHVIRDTWYQKRPRVEQHWFRAKLSVPERMRGGRHIIAAEFGAMQMQLYVNGKLCGESPEWALGTFFRADITEALREDGENELLFACRERAAAYEEEYLKTAKTLEEADISKATVFTAYWGKFGLLELVTVPEKCIEKEPRIVTSFREKTIEVFADAPQGTRLSHRVLRRGREIVPTFARKTGWANPVLWGPVEFPLLELESTLADAATGKTLDIRRTRFGFREIWGEGMSLMWNGKSVRGPGRAMGSRRYGERATRQDLLDEFVDLKRDGNVFRRHISGCREQYEFADEEGVLASRTGGFYPVGCYPAQYRGNRTYWDNMRKNVLRQVDDYPNNPSVYTWYVSNEFYLESFPEAQKDIEPVLSALQEKDPTRLVETGCDMDCGGRTGVISTHYPICEGFRTEEDYLPDLYYWRPVDKAFAPGMRVPCGLSSNVANQYVKSPIKWGTKPISVHETNWDWFIGFPHAPTRLWGDEAYNSIPNLDRLHLLYSIDYLRGERDAGPYMIVNWRQAGVDVNELVQPPLDAFALQKLHAFYEGAEIRYDIDFIHDVFADETLRIFWRLEDAGGKAVRRWQDEWHADFCQTRRTAAAFKAPKPGRYSLVYGFEDRLERRHSIEIYPASLAASVSPDALSAGGVVIVRPADAIDEKLMEKVCGGAKALVLPRADYPATLPVVPELTRRRSARNFTFRQDHPVLAGLSERDLSYWTPSSFTGTRFFDKPASGLVRTLVEAGGPNGLVYSALVEVPHGRGSIILSRLDLDPAANPLAAKLLANIRDYRPAPVEGTLGVLFDPKSPEVRILERFGAKMRVLSAGDEGEFAALYIDGARFAPGSFKAKGCGMIVRNPTSAWGVELRPFGKDWVKGRAVKTPAADNSRFLRGLTNTDFFWRSLAQGSFIPDQLANPAAASSTLGTSEIFGATALMYPRFAAEKDGVLFETLDWPTAAGGDRRKAERIVTTFLANCGVVLSPAKKLAVPDGLEFAPVDLSKVLNRSLADGTADDGKGGWSDQGPREDMREWKPKAGVQRLGNGVFDIRLPKTLFALRSKYRAVSEETPERVEVDVGRKAEWLFWLHGAAWCSKQDQAYIDVEYADGSVYTIRMSGALNMRDYPSAFPDALFPDEFDTLTCRAVTVPHALWGQASVYSTAWKNPQPAKKIARLVFRSAGRGVVMILAVSTANARGADGSARAPADVAQCEALMKEAAALKKAGKPAEAIEKLKEANAADPDMLPVYCETGDLYTALGDYARALVWYEKSLEINYNQPQLWERVKTAKARIAASGGGIAEKYPVAENVRGHENVEWSTAYAFGLTDGTKDLPRVLLVGDSICRGYLDGVRERLKGKVNVSYWTSSYCVTSPGYMKLLSFYLDEAKYDVIHFNNGLHSLQTSTEAWASGLKAALKLIREKQPGAKIVWCASTPLTDEVKTAKCRELNAAGAKIVSELGGIATNDLFALCEPLDRTANWSDVYHFRPEAIAKQADQVATAVLSALDRPCETAAREASADPAVVPILGYQLDVSRCKVPTMETLYRIVDIMASLGYNQFQLYTEHTFAYRKHETVWRDASPMTPSEVRALDDYCLARGIELVPNQNSFGHLENWLCHPGYNDLANHPQGGARVERFGNLVLSRPHALNPCDPDSLKFVAGLYDELLPCFRSRYVNVGCDETVELEDADGGGRSAAAVREKGAARVYVDFLKQIYGEVKKRGHVMMFWGDIVLHHPELLPEIPDDAICLNWGYEATSRFERKTAQLEAAGRRFVVCPGTSAWGSLSGRVENMLGNIDAAVAAGGRHGASGYLLADWGDGGTPQPWLVSLPALIYLSHRVKGEEVSRADLAKKIDDICGARCGEALLAYGGIYGKCGGEMGNNTELFNVLIKNDRYERSAGVTDETLEAAFSEWRRAKSLLDLDGAPDWVKDDFALLDLLYRAVEVKIKEPRRPNFRAMFEPEYRRLWLKQNRPGGLKDSLVQLFGP